MLLGIQFCLIMLNMILLAVRNQVRGNYQCSLQRIMQSYCGFKTVLKFKKWLFAVCTKQYSPYEWWTADDSYNMSLHERESWPNCCGWATALQHTLTLVTQQLPFKIHKIKLLYGCRFLNNKGDNNATCNKRKLLLKE